MPGAGAIPGLPPLVPSFELRDVQLLDAGGRSALQLPVVRGAVDEVLSQYGLKRQEAYRYSVSSASALGPMQFTNRRGNGTYALVATSAFVNEPN